MMMKNKGYATTAEGGTRTHTGLTPLDFESSASTYFATPARKLHYRLYIIDPDAIFDVMSQPITSLTV